ncbi:aldehyde dehydrogenase family protein [Nonomuraea phyllanthi]|uniref:aldehyde dehydrogenase (NAD(+)) n=1 Tax=Nonomuraea phyllanthi TaxID=2219224 RepID=A0A5C4W6C5_9ACTN|nr:aldehyde dehydrogenase family protein [Nonomuraea phyllanthi]KAB8191881.1 aldehyde dehydrogenase family protein [Nonomuraea phyllanthi]
MIERDDLLIAGAWTAPLGDAPATLDVVDPATDQVVGRVPAGSVADVDAAVRAAAAAFPAWSQVSMAERVALVERIRAGVEERREELAGLLTLQMGTPITFARQAQLGVALADLDEIVKAGRDYAAEESIGGALVVREPAGVVAAITPWNFPLHQIALKVGAALVAGCTVVLKPSELTPLDAYVFAEIVQAAGVPAGVFNLVPGDGPVTGEALVAHPLVDVVTLTGSVRAGARVAELAARTVKKVTLELGGKSAGIVLDDADLETVVPQAVGGCFANSGQICAALTRLLVPEHLLEEVERLAADAAAGWVPGPPSDPATKLGPQASRRQQRIVQDYIRAGVAEGARLIVGGTETIAGGAGTGGPGAYVTPTVFSRVRPEMTIAREEIFGPVLSIMSYATEDEAVAIANDSEYGLSGGVWSADPARALAVARRLRTGMVSVNGAGLNVAAPFGGYRRSGVGRECGRYGIEEFLETKTVVGLPEAIA